MTMIRIGGCCASMVRICTGEVWVRSTGGGCVALCRQVERVVVGARRVVCGDVQRAEIDPVDFDVRTFGDRAAHGAEDGGDLLHRAADRVDQAGLARARRQGGVEPLVRQAGVQLGVFQCRAARLDQGGQGVLEPVQRGAPLAALFGRGLAEVAQQPGQAAVPAEQWRCGQRPRRAGRRRQRGQLRFRPGRRRGRRSCGLARARRQPFPPSPRVERKCPGLAVRPAPS